MVAIAIANEPAVLIADEPTTALDVTIQAQLVDVLEVSRRESGAAAIWITHDLGLVAEIADRVVVMYAGRVVETGTVDDIFNSPKHPYTAGLLDGLPRLDAHVDRLVPIPGQPPNLHSVPTGCAFHPRCPVSGGREVCIEMSPDLDPVGPAHSAACHFSDEVELAVDLDVS
jgi:oligopeptide/dipeptide ABC transporter ATP-binding protein